jgi:hypothetical protein
LLKRGLQSEGAPDVGWGILSHLFFFVGVHTAPGMVLPMDAQYVVEVLNDFWGVYWVGRMGLAFGLLVGLVSGLPAGNVGNTGMRSGLRGVLITRSISFLSLHCTALNHLLFAIFVCGL